MGGKEKDVLIVSATPLILEKSLELKLGLTLLKGVQVALWLSTHTLGQTLESVENRRTASITKQFKKHLRPTFSIQ